jgi:hypothetical protein
MKSIVMTVLLLCPMTTLRGAAQIVAGSPEDKAFQKVHAETDTEKKLQKLLLFERQFPNSKVLGSIYLMIVEYYQLKDDRVTMVEYAEKVLNLDKGNVTAMLVLSRNYAIERKNLDRAVELAQKAGYLIGKMRTAPVPSTHTDVQWKDYLENTDAAARRILSYTLSVRGQ